MTPLIDCVFLLLIFFMVTHAYSSNPTACRWSLPEAQQGVIVEEKKLVASITQDGRMEINRHLVDLGQSGAGSFARERRHSESDAGGAHRSGDPA